MSLSDKVLVMLKNLYAIGYYDSFEGQCKYRFVQREGTYQGINFSCASCRVGRKQVSDILKGKCPLCHLFEPNLPLPLTKIKFIDWSRRFIIIPNAFPYLENHINFISKQHETQDIIRQKHVIEDITFFYTQLGKHKWTLFFNHLIGNSLNHFHVHATTEKDFPIFNLIEARHKENKRKIQILKFTPCYKGILIYKPNPELLFAIISKIEANEYLNFAWSGKYFVLFLRKWSPDHPEANSIGSTELAGYILTCNFQKLDQVLSYCRKDFFPSYSRWKEIISLHS